MLAWFAAGAATILALLALVMLPQQADHGPESSAPKPASTVRTQAGADSMRPVAKEPARGTRSAWSAELAEALTAEAEAGNPAALASMGSAWAECSDWEPMAREDVDLVLVDLAMLPGLSGPLGDALSNKEGGLEMLLGGIEALSVQCSALDLPDLPEQRLAQALEWLDAAARAGNHAAMVAWSEHVFARWPGRAEMLDELEAVRPARDQARAWLNAALAAREPSALRRMALAHHRGDLAARDSVAAYAYLLAWHWGGFDASTPEVSAMRRRELSLELNESAQAEAEAMARQLLQEFGG
jgi:TPR repeat protein